MTLGMRNWESKFEVKRSRPL